MDPRCFTWQSNREIEWDQLERTSLPVTSSCQGSHNSAIFASIEANFSSGGDPAGDHHFEQGRPLAMFCETRHAYRNVIASGKTNCNNRKSSNKMEVLMRKSKIIYKLAIFHCHVWGGYVWKRDFSSCSSQPLLLEIKCNSYFLDPTSYFWPIHLFLPSLSHDIPQTMCNQF